MNEVIDQGFEKSQRRGALLHNRLITLRIAGILRRLLTVLETRTIRLLNLSWLWIKSLISI